MDIASSALSIASISLSLISQLSALYVGINASPHHSPKKILSELPVLLSLLEEIKEITLHSRTAPTPAVAAAMNQCGDQFTELSSLLSKMGIDLPAEQLSIGRRKRPNRAAQIMLRLDTSPLQESTKRFRSSLTLLRDMVMDLRTHDLLAQHQEYMEYKFEAIQQALAAGKNTSQIKEIDLDHLDLEPLPEVSSNEGLRFGGGGSSLFNISFSLDPEPGERPVFFPARAKFDTGCDDNLISESLVRKYNLQAWQKPIPTRTYLTLGNSRTLSTFQISLNWCANNEELLRTDLFNVVPASPFELILGEQFISANNMLFNRTMRTAFPIRLKPRDVETKKAEINNERVKDQTQGGDLIEKRKAAKKAKIASQATGPQAQVPQSSPSAGQVQAAPQAASVIPGAGANPASGIVQDPQSSSSASQTQAASQTANGMPGAGADPAGGIAQDPQSSASVGQANQGTPQIANGILGVGANPASGTVQHPQSSASVGQANQAAPQRANGIPGVGAKPASETVQDSRISSSDSQASYTTLTSASTVNGTPIGNGRARPAAQGFFTRYFASGRKFNHRNDV